MHEAQHVEINKHTVYLTVTFLLRVVFSRTITKSDVWVLETDKSVLVLAFTGLLCHHSHPTHSQESDQKVGCSN